VQLAHANARELKLLLAVRRGERRVPARVPHVPRSVPQDERWPSLAGAQEQLRLAP
jgi:hypothetical protein